MPTVRVLTTGHGEAPNTEPTADGAGGYSWQSTSAASGTQLTGCTRGYHGTTAASHPNASPAFTGRGVYGTGSSATPSILVVERKWAI